MDIETLIDNKIAAEDILPAIELLLQELSKNINADNHKLLFKLAKCYKQVVDYKQAIVVLKKAIQLAPTILRYYIVLAEVYRLNGQKTAALAVCDNASLNTMHDKIYFLQMSYVYNLLNATDKLAAVLTEGLNIFPREPELLHYQAFLYAAQGDVDAAIRLRKKLEFMNLHQDSYISNLFSLGILLEKQANYQDAFGYFVRANKLCAKNALGLSGQYKQQL